MGGEPSAARTIGIGRMDTRTGLTKRLLAALAIRPAAPGLILVVGLAVLAVSGRPVTSVVWFWPVCTGLLVLAVVMNAAHQDIWRRLQGREHKQRMDTANALLNEHPPIVEPEPEITGSIRELGGLVKRFGHKLDDLLAEVHTEKSSAEHRPHRS